MRWFCGSCCCVRNLRKPPVTSGRQLSADDYLDGRLKVVLAKFDRLAPKLQAWHRGLWVVVIMLTSLNAMFALMPVKQWIPIMVAFAACLQSISKDQRLEERLVSINAAVTKLNNLVSWWFKLTLVERRLDNNFHHLVEACEEVAYNDFVWTSGLEPGKEDDRAAAKGRAAGDNGASQKGQRAMSASEGSAAAVEDKV